MSSVNYFIKTNMLLSHWSKQQRFMSTKGEVEIRSLAKKAIGSTIVTVYQEAAKLDSIKYRSCNGGILYLSFMPKQNITGNPFILVGLRTLNNGYLYIRTEEKFLLLEEPINNMLDGLIKSKDKFKDSEEKESLFECVNNLKRRSFDCYKDFLKDYEVFYQKNRNKQKVKVQPQKPEKKSFSLQSILDEPMVLEKNLKRKIVSVEEELPRKKSNIAETDFTVLQGSILLENKKALLIKSNEIIEKIMNLKNEIEKDMIVLKKIIDEQLV